MVWSVCQQIACRLSAKESLTPVICSFVNDAKLWYWMSSLSAQTLSHSEVRVVTDLQLSSWRCGQSGDNRTDRTSEMAGFHSVDVDVSGLPRTLRCVAGVTYTDVSGELGTFFFKKWVRVGARVSRGACCLHIQGRNVVSHIDSWPSRFTKRIVYCLARDIRIGTWETLSYLPHFDPERGSVFCLLSTRLERILIQAMQNPTRVPTTHCESSKSAHVDRLRVPELPRIVMSTFNICTKGSGSSFPGDKAVRAWSWSVLPVYLKVVPRDNSAFTSLQGVHFG
jgi:hypothetical protein